MKCPHCTLGIHEGWQQFGGTFEDVDAPWAIHHMTCPECSRIILRLHNRATGVMQLLRPRAPARAPLSPDVPEKYAQDYREGCFVLADSPKASAALSRRCLQQLLREKAGVKPGNLSDEIDQARKTLPSHLADAIDAIRNIGNFAAHPLKGTNSGEVVEVEPGEAEWSLDVLEGLFDHYFVQPAVLQQKRGALNQKLQEAGKPPMK
jgi:hypothetical protein